MSAPAVRTVLGDVAPDTLGFCDAHDHLFFASAQLPGEELDDVDAARAELQAYAAAGGRSVVQWTPAGLNRRMTEVADLSRTTGVQVVAATGRHQQAHHRDTEYSAERFIEHLTAPVPAGLIKIAGEFCGPGPAAVYAAAAAAHRATGAPIAVHLELGTGGESVLGELCGRLGIPPDAVILGHVGRNPDSREHRRLAATGVFLAFDGPSRRHHALDWRLVEELAVLADAGYADRLLLGMDTALASMRAAPGMRYLPGTLYPVLARELGPPLADAVTVANPARAFAADWRLPVRPA